MKALKLHLLQTLRDPAFLILTASGGLILYLGYSNGGWSSIAGIGRQMLSVSFHFFSALTGLLVLSVVLPQLRHTDELWSTARPLLPRILQQGLSLLLAALLSILLSMVLVVPFKAAWEAFSFSGGEYFAVYAVLTAIYLALWLSVGMAAAYLFRSRVLTIAIPAILWATVWIGLPMILILGLASGEGLTSGPVILRFLTPSGLFNFTALAPLGVLPAGTLWVAMVMVGVVFVLLAVILLRLRRNDSSSKSIHTAVFVIFLVFGGLGIVAGTMGLAQVAGSAVADYSVMRLIQGQAEIESPPHVLDSRGHIIAVTGDYTAFYYPQNIPLPEWVEQRTQSAQYHALRLNEIVLSYPAGRTYPSELDGVAKHVESLIELAQPWLGVKRRLVVIPRQLSFTQDPSGWSFFRGRIYYDEQEGLILSEDVIAEGLDEGASWLIAITLTEAAGFHEIANVYLALVLLAQIQPHTVETILALSTEMMETETPATRVAQYDYVAPNQTQAELLAARERIPSLRINLTAPTGNTNPQGASSFAELVKQLEAHKWPGIHSTRDRLVSLRVIQIHDPYDAWLLLQYWQAGVAAGHENFIQTFTGAVEGDAREG